MWAECERRFRHTEWTARKQPVSARTGASGAQRQARVTASSRRPGARSGLDNARRRGGCSRRCR
jgi:hypothetical protein